jgi:hypothetical protein
MNFQTQLIRQGKQWGFRLDNNPCLPIFPLQARTKSQAEKELLSRSEIPSETLFWFLNHWRMRIDCGQCAGFEIALGQDHEMSSQRGAEIATANRFECLGCNAMQIKSGQKHEIIWFDVQAGSWQFYETFATLPFSNNFWLSR